jgi:hypothetical protein
MRPTPISGIALAFAKNRKRAAMAIDAFGLRRHPISSNLRKR